MGMHTNLLPSRQLAGEISCAENHHPRDVDFECTLLLRAADCNFPATAQERSCLGASLPQPPKFGRGNLSAEPISQLREKAAQNRFTAKSAEGAE